MRRNLSENIKSIFSRYIHSRIAVTTTIMILFSFILVGRIFYLQIIMGDEYQSDHTLNIIKTRSITATRGSIYDRNGNLLAYDKLAYAVTFEDTGDYDTNAEMNAALETIIQIIKSHDDSIDDNDFEIDYKDGEFSFNVSGTTLDRFRADVYGHTYTTDLSATEATATAEEIVSQLLDKYGIHCELNPLDSDSDETMYEMEDAYELLVVRFAIAANSYQKYIETTIASDVSEETVADIEENSADIMGVEIAEQTVRVYNNSEYFAHIIGYTGTISEEEYEELSEERSDYSLTDKVGKSGIEQYCETYLQGVKGSETVYVDNLGTVLEVSESTEAEAGSDVYLTIDMDLQIAVYDLLEEELASILYSKISNIDDYEISSETSASDIVIPINDVYYALINNSVLDISSFSDDDAGSYEQAIYEAYTSYSKSVIKDIDEELTDSDTAFEDLDDEMTDYENYIMELIYNLGIVDKDAVDTSSEEYLAWKEGTGSLKEYLEYNISTDNIDTSLLDVSDSYADTSEIYEVLIAYVEDRIITEEDFQKLIYKYLIDKDKISGYQVCMALYDQGVLKKKKDDDYTDLKNGTISAYTFIKNKIKDLSITPAQLALDPCNASSVIVDPNSGEVLACVTYPGYDNNKMANSVDSDYYSSLTNDLSYPLLNYATQQKTAPGSTFKMITATAALTENYVTTTEKIKDKGEFEKITPSPSCWIYPSSTHGKINVSEAIRDSCNYFFYELGYRFATEDETANYDDDAGLSLLSKYASAYGLDANTGIEISESTPEISDEDAVRSAIGQGTNNFTTSQLARYVATVANSGTCYNLSMISKVTDNQSNVIEEFSSSVYNELTDVTSSTWSAIHKGMRMVVKELDAFDDFGVAVAGKTGTAQETTTRPNHALFVCYAPYKSPTVAIATRIPYGYTSANAAEVTSYILQYYFDLNDIDDITQEISNAGGNSYVND